MARFASGAFRIPKKKRGSKKKFATTWLDSYSEVEDGKRRINYEGMRRLEEYVKIKRQRAAFLEKLKRKRFIKQIFSRPISFRAKDGTRIRILRHGFYNIFGDSPAIPGRALAMVFAQGKLIFFYKSSGQSSKRPGEWFPTTGPDVLRLGSGKLSLGHIAKMEGHPRRGEIPPSFPEWVDEVNQNLKASEKKMIFHPGWNAETYLQIQGILSKIPFTERLGVER